MATLVSPISRSTVIWFRSLEFVSTGFGYDMILLWVKGPGGARIAPARLRCGRRHQEKVWSAPPSPLCLVTIASLCQAGGDAGADNPARRNRGYDGPTPRGSHYHVGRRRVLRALACHDAASTRAVRPKKSADVQSGQRRNVTRQDDMSKRPDVRGETNGPPTRC